MSAASDDPTFPMMKHLLRAESPYLRVQRIRSRNESTFEPRVDSPGLPLPVRVLLDMLEQLVYFNECPFAHAIQVLHLRIVVALGSHQSQGM